VSEPLSGDAHSAGIPHPLHEGITQGHDGCLATIPPVRATFLSPFILADIEGLWYHVVRFLVTALRIAVMSRPVSRGVLLVG
jgi:hypothetical protein